MAPAD